MHRSQPQALRTYRPQPEVEPALRLLEAPVANTAHYNSLLGALHAPQEEPAAALAGLEEGHDSV